MMSEINILIIHVYIVLLIIIKKIYKCKIFDYIKLFYVITTVLIGSYGKNYIYKEKSYWNYISNITLKNKIIYKNTNCLNNLKNGYLIISNHVNITDVVLIRKMIDCYVVGKDSIISKEYSYLQCVDNIFFNNLKIIPYKRNNAKSGNIVKKKILSKISNNENVLIFPEGTSQKNCHNGILPFKKGLFYLAYKYNIKIVPTVIYYTDKNYGLDKETVFSLNDILNNNNKIYVNFMDPIKPSDSTNVDELINKIYNKMNGIIDKYNIKYSKK
jgi:1-acyl-sn-glycerol-3-phosphate acyltransferase